MATGNETKTGMEVAADAVKTIGTAVVAGVEASVGTVQNKIQEEKEEKKEEHQDPKDADKKDKKNDNDSVFNKAREWVDSLISTCVPTSWQDTIKGFFADNTIIGGILDSLASTTIGSYICSFLGYKPSAIPKSPEDELKQRKLLAETEATEADAAIKKAQAAAALNKTDAGNSSGGNPNPPINPSVDADEKAEAQRLAAANQAGNTDAPPDDHTPKMLTSRTSFSNAANIGGSREATAQYLQQMIDASKPTGSAVSDLTAKIDRLPTGLVHSKF